MHSPQECSWWGLLILFVRLPALKLKLADAEASMDRGRATVIHSLLNKALSDQAAASKKAAAEAKQHAAEAKRQESAAAALTTRITNLNDNFRLQTEQGKVTSLGVQKYEQALDKARDAAHKLPPALTGTIGSLLSQGDALAKTGAAAATAAAQHKAYEARLKSLKTETASLTLTELERTRAQIVANGADPAKLEIVDKQIAAIKKAQSEGQALLAESQVSSQKAVTGQLQAQYEQRRTDVGQNLAQLLQVEKDFGSRLVAVKNQQAHDEADAEKLKVAAQFDAQITANAKDGALVTQLKAQKTKALADIDAAYTSAALVNQTAQQQAQQSAQQRFDAALVTQDRATRKLLLQQAIQAAGDGTSDLEGRQAEELNVESLTAQQRLDILNKYRPLLAQAKRDEVAAQRSAALDEEAALFEDAKTTALGQGLGLENVNKDHTARMAAIDRQYGDGVKADGKDLSTYLLKLQKDVASAQTAVNTAQTAANTAQVAEQKRHDAAVTAQDRASRKLQLAETLKSATDETAALEGRRNEALAAENLNAQQRLDVLKKFQPLLAQAKRDEIAAQRTAQLEEEATTWAEAQATATEQGLSLEKVNADHVARLAAITRQYGDGQEQEGRDLSSYLAGLQKDTNAAQTTLQKQHDQALAALIRESRKLQLAETLRAASDQTKTLENQQRDDLAVEDLTAAERLAIIQKYSPLLAQAKRDEVAAQRKALVDEEANLYADAQAEAIRQGDGLELVNKDHVARMAAIDRQYGDGAKVQGQDLTDYLAGLTKDLTTARTAATKETASDLKQAISDNKDAAKQVIEDALSDLGTLTGAQRESLRQTLEGLRTFYSFMGPAGAEAVKQLDVAIKRIDEVGNKARAVAASLVVDPTTASDDLNSKLAKIGAPENAEDAREKAVAQFADIRKVYTDGIDEITLKLKDFEGHPLTLDQAATKLSLEGTVKLFTGFVGRIDTQAREAGDKAASAFTDAATDASHQADLELAKSLHESGMLTDAGYQQALSDYAAYMHSRVLRFKEGTKEYSQAQIAAFQADQAASQNNTKKLDSQATAALALAKKRGDEVTKNGGNGAAVYKAGLEVARKYWQGRLAGLKGTDEQTSAERETIQQTISDLGQNIENLVYDSPLTNALDKAAELIGGLGMASNLSGYGQSIAQLNQQIELDKQLGAAATQALKAHQGLLTIMESSKTTAQFGTAILGSLGGLSAYFKAGGGSKGILMGASAFMGSLADVFKTGDENVDKVTTTFVQGVQGVIGSLAKGDWIGAAIGAVATVVGTILNIIQGAQRSLAKAKSEIEAAGKDIKFFDVGKYAVTETYRGGFLGLQTLTRSVIDQTSIDIAKSLGDAIYQGISTGMLDGIKAGKTSFADLGIDLKKTLGNQILQGLIDGFLKGAVMQAALQPFLDAYITAMKAGDAKGLAAAAKNIQNAAITANSQLQDFYENVLVPTAKSLNVFGAGPEGSIDALNGKKSNLTAKLQQAATPEERDDIQTQIQEVQDRIDDASGTTAKSLTSSQDKLTTLQNRLATQNRTLANLKIDLRNATTEDQRTKLNNRIASQEQAIGVTQSAITATRSDISSLGPDAGISSLTPSVSATSPTVISSGNAQAQLGVGPTQLASTINLDLSGTLASVMGTAGPQISQGGRDVAAGGADLIRTAGVMAASIAQLASVVNQAETGWVRK